MKNIKDNIKWILPSLIIGLVFGWIFFGGSSKTNDTHEHQHAEEKAEVWTCSMHPQIKQNKFGLCPICAMDLIPLASMGGGEDVSPNEIQMTESAAKLAEIKTMFVKKGNPDKSVYLQGKVQADERNIAELTSRFGGRIEKLFVNFTGQYVRKGEKLATIYSPELVTAQKELLEALAYKDSYKSLYIAAKGKLKLWDLTDEQILAIEEKGEPQLYFEVLSPISGTVMMRHVAIGDYVKEGSQLFKLANLKQLWVMFDAYETDLPWIKLQDEITFSVQSVPGKEFEGNVSYIDPFLNPSTRVAKVRVEIDNQNMELKPEMFTSGVLVSKIAEDNDQILIPKSSILWTGKRSVIYVKVPDRESPSFLYREITLGPEAGNFYVVHSGLEEGEEIVVNGVFKIDASAQLQGLPSMMNPHGGMTSGGHNHGDMNIGSTVQGSGHSMFKVFGNCGMCKDRIEEAALSVSGVTSANWESKDGMLHLNFHEGHVDIADVHKAIAAVGHDTEHERAPDNIYDALPGCCLYDRPAPLAHSMFKVYGNCGMCKDRIEEAALSVEGVASANWESEDGMLRLNFHEGHVDIADVHKAIAAVGHDTSLERAPDEVYNELHSCCLYERKK